MAELRDARVPALANEVAMAYRESGRNLWLVGGWVRDALLGNMHTDLDFTTDARPEESLKILKSWSKGKVWTTGIEFGTVGARLGDSQIEVTTFRRESYSPDSRNPTVVFADDLTTDLSRRDFTINAIALSLPEVEVVDPFGGLADLAAARIRTPLSPQEAFTDDPLRMLRAVRFSATLGFRIDKEVIKAIKEMHGRLGIVSRERVRDEFSKLMMGKEASAALAVAVSTGLADEFLPELPALRLEQDPIHRHKDVFGHTLAVLDNVMAAEQKPDLALRVGALMHDIGKPRTRQITPKGVSFHHHEVVGAEMTAARLRELRFPAKFIEEVKDLVYLHLRFHTYRLGWTDRAVRRYVRDAGPWLYKLNALVRSDCTTRNVAKARMLAQRMDELEERITTLSETEELMRLRPALDGTEVMQLLDITPGPMVGDALNFLMEIRIEEGEIPKDEAEKRLNEWWVSRDG